MLGRRETETTINWMAEPVWDWTGRKALTENAVKVFIQIWKFGSYLNIISNHV